jgi:hypothetical protein
LPGEYSQFCPALVHTPLGLSGDPSLELLAGGHATRNNTRMESADVFLIEPAYP